MRSTITDMEIDGRDITIWFEHRLSLKSMERSLLDKMDSFVLSHLLLEIASCLATMFQHFQTEVKSPSWTLYGLIASNFSELSFIVGQ